jgi:hypothetical protein
MRLGRVSRELLLVCVGALVVAAALTWPTLQHPASTIAADLGDPLLLAYAMSWEGHALLTDPAGLWTTNAFFPEPLSLAYSDTLLGYAPLAMLGSGPAAALLHYNLLYWLIPALASVGAYALARQLGSKVPGALVAGLAFAYAPWRLGQAGHLHVLSTGGIALALAMLARGYGYSFSRGYRPDEVRTGWIVAGWLVAAWQLTLGFGIGLPFVYVLLLGCLVAVVRWGLAGTRGRTRPPISRPMLLCTLAGGVLFAAVAVLMGQPYLRVAAEFPGAIRTVGDLQLFSAPLRGFFAVAPTSTIWGEPTAAILKTLAAPAEMALFPGFVLVVMAFAGLGYSAWTGRQRIWLALGALVTAVLCMGTNFFGGTFTYLPLLVLPGWDGLRTPGRLVVWLTLMLALLAAGFLTELQNSLIPGVPGQSRIQARWKVAALLVPALLVAVEGLNTIAHPSPQPPPAALRQVPTPVLVLPSDQWWDLQTMWWSTAGFPTMANGASGFVPPATAAIRSNAEHFPDPASIAALRAAGIRTVVLVPGNAYGTPWERAVDVPVTGLGITRTIVGETIVYRLS